MSYYARHLFLTILVVFGFAMDSFAAITVQNDIRDVVNRFCEAEFGGAVDARIETNGLVVFSQKRKNLERIRDPEFGGQVLSLEADPVYVVSSYKISSLEMRNGEATAIVLYATLAKSEGDGFENRKLVLYQGKEDKVELKLSYRGGKWRIVDPLTPRVSKEAMVGRYQKSIRQYKEIIDRPTISNAQKKAYHKELETLRFLEAL